MSRSEIKEILTKYKTIAVVGLSRETYKDSRRVSAYLKKHGFRIIPANTLGMKCWAKEATVGFLTFHVKVEKPLDVVDIFIPSRYLLLTVKQAVELKEIY